MSFPSLNHGPLLLNMCVSVNMRAAFTCTNMYGVTNAQRELGGYLPSSHVARRTRWLCHRRGPKERCVSTVFEAPLLLLPSLLRFLDSFAILKREVWRSCDLTRNMLFSDALDVSCRVKQRAKAVSCMMLGVFNSYYRWKRDMVFNVKKYIVFFFCLIHISLPNSALTHHI